MWHGHSWLYMHQCQLTSCTKGCSNGQLWNSLFITTSIIAHRFVVLSSWWAFCSDKFGGRHHATMIVRWINHRLTKNIQHLFPSCGVSNLLWQLRFESYGYVWPVTRGAPVTEDKNPKHILYISQPERKKDEPSWVSGSLCPSIWNAHPSLSLIRHHPNNR